MSILHATYSYLLLIAFGAMALFGLIALVVYRAVKRWFAREKENEDLWDAHS